MHNAIKKRFILKDLIFPFIAWAGMIFVFLYIKDIPYDFSGNDTIVIRYLAKFIMTISAPLVLIQLLYKDKSHYGIYFPTFSDSFKLSLRAYAIGGPAGITFWLIALLGWEFSDWSGAITLSIVYAIVLYFIPKVTRKLPTRSSIIKPNNQIIAFVIFSIATMVIAYFTYEHMPVISKILYYLFIVGFGEELLFRGYLQSSFNRYFGRPFTIGTVKFGWGLVLAALLFGLVHALVIVPPAWPWALFTFVLGLVLGFIREKDGSILAAVLLHALLDMPLAFMN